MSPDAWSRGPRRQPKGRHTTSSSYSHDFMTSSPDGSRVAAPTPTTPAAWGHSGVRSKILLLHFVKDLQHVTPPFVTWFHNSFIICDISLTCNHFSSNHSPWITVSLQESTEALHSYTREAVILATFQAPPSMRRAAGSIAIFTLSRIIFVDKA